MSLIQRIDALLPQTQCGKCGHPGCKPYAEGIADGEPINKCPPGGDETIAALAELLKIPVLELDISRGSAPPQVAYIREAECIGCTKCIQACPIDAIVGAAKLMHTVIIDECTGCDLCVAPCPVDCIEMHPLPLGTLPVVGGLAISLEEQQARAAKRDHARQRFERRNARLQREEQQKQAEREARAQRAAQAEVAATTLDPVQAALERVRAQKAATADAALKKAKIDVAMSRAQLNKSLKAFGHPPTYDQQSQLIVLQQQFEAAEQALAQLEKSAAPAPVVAAPAKDADLKKAKIQLAMRRAELKKAQTAEAPPAEIAALEQALRDAEQALHNAEAASNQPAPELVRVEKRPIDDQLRQLKTELAYARADLNKLQRRDGTPTDILEKARARLQEAERQVQAHVIH
ncbi:MULTISPECIES: electron transport complex subunit RsxB [Pseudomonas]|uniref:Ion-translocating oxidoreductase complex subunit B n=1 Tax=Pseudomonas fluorescens (strain Pf0-1) TaxID=205922 RepID=Q3K7K8_PSEPF|nr:MULTISPECIES: electron transport complex subunit RsxB [Pseudomonas]ABA76246.1 putative electron transpor-related protein [Pseudomonas fluorescens Pf0-1]MBL0794105.1 electron transport complex subunit RsxB [Pseudomonas sp. B7]MBX8623114.1 electron transport complex subunit RsxB [Pseudomonas glycinae]MBY9024175.1 electron transport complex subunit RsxB [Pseudomonas fluorescens]MBY9030488.1 electron transport complex subunit RsxB [Pseudomonas fluorescens]